MKKTIGTYFTGGGLFDAGAKDAGLTPVFGVEYDPHPKRTKTSMKIADMYEANFGNHMIRKPVQDIDPSDLPSVYWFHASPVCKNFSNAKKGGVEDDVDIVTAQATVDYIECHLPKVVTIENVRGYAGSDALILILRCLSKNGYSFREDIINMANYGVPQTRIRLIVTAVLDSPVPSLTPSTHEKTPGGIFALPKWVSWYTGEDEVISYNPTYKHLQKTNQYDNAIFDMQNVSFSESKLTVRFLDDPLFSVISSKSPTTYMVKLEGVYYYPKPCVISRSCGLPYWYKLSGHNTTDYTALGNGVPSMFVQKHVEYVLSKM